MKRDAIGHMEAVDEIALLNAGIVWSKQTIYGCALKYSVAKESSFHERLACLRYFDAVKCTLWKTIQLQVQ